LKYLIVGVWIAAWIMGVVPSAHAQENHTLAFFETVQGAINDATPAEEWTFEGHTNQVISVIVMATSGDLDPVLHLVGPDAAVVGENDDLDSLVRDAGLEAFVLPLEGVYTVRVTRYGATVGEYDLTLTPGFARPLRDDTFEQGAVSWVSPAGQLAVLSQGKLQMRVMEPGETQMAFPPDAESEQNLYMQVDARVFGTPSYAEVGLVFRAQVEQGRVRAYQFKVNTNGQWTIALQEEAGLFVLRTWQADPALAGSAWTLAVLARDENFAFYANGALLGTLSDARLPSAGTVGVMVMNRTDQAGAATVLFDNVLVTARLGSTYRGLPLALTTWNSPDPAVVAAELAESGGIIPAAARDLFVPDTSLTRADQNAEFKLLGSERAIYENFILSAWVNIATTGQSVACGVTYRWQDERNLDMAYLDTAGGFGVVQARDGQLTTNVYDLSPMVHAGANNLIVITRGDRVTLYVNGALVTQETVIPGSGRVGVALLNYEAARTDCFWTNYWVWPLESAGP
jgi:hypothetical protein